MVLYLEHCLELASKLNEFTKAHRVVDHGVTADSWLGRLLLMLPPAITVFSCCIVRCVVAVLGRHRLRLKQKVFFGRTFWRHITKSVKAGWLTG